MKKAFISLFAILIGFFAINTAMAKKVKPATEHSISNERGVEGDKNRVENVNMQGIEMADALSDDGTKIIQIPYRWYAAIGESNDKQTAIEIAQREAYAVISRTLENAVYDQASKGTLANNENVKKALQSHWEQVSSSIQRGCEPFGNTTIEYNKKKKCYVATAKIGIRGDKYAQMMNQAKESRPSGLSDEELQLFIEANNAIIDETR